MLVLTRPDVIAELHDAFFEVGVDVVETDTFGAFAVPLGEYGIADQAYEINVGRRRASPSEVADAAHADGRCVAGLDRPRHQVRRRSARSASPTCATPTRCRPRACSRAASTCCSSRPSSTCSALKAAVDRRAAGPWRPTGREVPIQVQVTMELTGRMLPGTEIGAALAASTRCGPTSSASTAPPAPPR